MSVASKANENRKAQEILERFAGVEPKAGSDLTNPQDFDRACKYYRTLHSTADAWYFLKIYFENIKDKEILNSWNFLNSSNVSMSTCYIARMKTMKMIISDENNQKFDNDIQNLRNYINSEDFEKNKNSPWKPYIVKKLPIHNIFMIEIEKVVDDFVNGKNFNISKENYGLWINSFGVETYDNLNFVIDNINLKIQGIEEDFNFIKSNKNEIKNYNEECKIHENIIEFYKNIVASCVILLKGKSEGKPPAKTNLIKTAAYVSVEKICKKINQVYFKHDTDLNVTSISPEKIIGKKLIVIYDVGQRVMKIISSEEGKTLTFNNTALVNVDMKKSWEKKISKTDFVKEVQNLNKTDFTKKFEALNVKKYELKTVYINKQTMFLKTF